MNKQDVIDQKAKIEALLARVGDIRSGLAKLKDRIPDDSEVSDIRDNIDAESLDNASEALENASGRLGQAGSYLDDAVTELEGFEADLEQARDSLTESIRDPKADLRSADEINEEEEEEEPEYEDEFVPEP